MKIRPSILLLCVSAIAVVILAIVWRGKQTALPTAGTAPTNAVVAQAVPSPPMPTLAKTNGPGLAAPHVGTPHFVPQTVNPSYAKEHDEAWRETLATKNTMPIVFYGKLEDQFGNPVIGAEITGNTIINNGSMYGHTNVVAVSDSNGFFTLDAGAGEGIGLVPQKSGYALAATNTYFRYSLLYPDHITSDPNRPIVIKMWKLQRAEPLVSIDKTYKLPYTATPICFDLVAGQIVSSGGDLRITVNRPAGVISGANPQDWSIEFEVIGGGFIETTSGEAGVTFFAPESGYQASGTFGKNNGPDLIDKTLFIQSRNGQVCSKVHLLFGINVKPDGFMDVTFSGVANTNGSGNWEATASQSN